MIKSLKFIQKLKVLRPILNGMELDKNGMPIIKANNIDFDDILELRTTHYSNLKYAKSKSKTLLNGFCNDDVLERFWNNPLKYVVAFFEFLRIGSPDFSIYPGMSRYEIEHNVFKNRWLGALWQLYGIKVIPTIGWGDKTTYDICFSGVEPGSMVIISTIGCQKNTDIFIEGYHEMMKRINPPLVIVIGKIMDGMYGKILCFDYIDTFVSKSNSNQLSFFNNNEIISIEKGGVSCGK